MLLVDVLFVLALGGFFFFVLRWGFRHFPQEKWQIIATIPLFKSDSGEWQGTNLTLYGLITACAYAVSVALVFVLLGALGTSPWHVFPIAAAILAVVIPASSLIARWVEKKRFTFSIGGASFAGIVVAPWVIVLADQYWLGAQQAIPVMPALAAFAIAYAIGEGIGRLACISFGCCYGKPVATCSPFTRSLFQRWHFIFHGKTKKIAYEGKMDGQPVMPIQAITAVLYVGTGLVAILLFLVGRYATALLLALVVTQVWRVASEMLRADYRGEGRISAYQILAGVAVLYTIALTVLLPATQPAHADIVQGLGALWDPGMILLLLGLWTATFVHAGRSMVTTARLSFYVCEDRI